MDILRNLQDLSSNPAQYAEMVIDRLKNFNRGEKAVISPAGAGMVPMTLEERAQQVTQGALDNLGGGGMGALGVIKNKGGNWLAGKQGPEELLRRLKREDAPELNQFIEGPLTKYFKNEMATPTDPVRLLADAWPAEKAKKLAEAEARVKALRTKQEAQAATRGVPEEYLTRTRQDVLSAEEARDIIEANAGLHVAPEQLPFRTQHNREMTMLMRNRQNAGMPVENMATSDTGAAWETAADRAIAQHWVASLRKTPTAKQPENAWLQTAPDAPVNVLTMQDPAELGFNHLTDELYNLLREGKLEPKQVARMPMADAVRAVAEVNALRKVKSQQEQAMELANIPLHKDYPEQGMSWRQLKSDDTPTLQKWLTQEGDAMGHCVGGYCADVQSGESNIYSLRDAKGKPYVTIETGPLSLSADDRAPEILQVKGPGNAAPAEEHLPFVQDFIRSGQWSDIRDLQNTGLTPEEINALIKR